MIGFTSGARSPGPPLRVVFIGSCRTDQPVRALAERDEVEPCCSVLSPNTYTAAEALQLVEIELGNRYIPDELAPYVFGPDPFIPAEEWREFGRGVDVCWVEVSARNQFYYRGAYIQQNMLERILVQPRRAALLPWFRTLVREGAAGEACVENARERLVREGFDHDDRLIDLLREVRREIPSAGEVEADLGSILSRLGGRLIVCGAIVAPESSGAVADQRRLLNQMLARVADSCGTEFYDPSELLEGRDRTTVFDRGGADEYHFAPDFYLTVGEAMESRLRITPPARASVVTAGVLESG